MTARVKIIKNVNILAKVYLMHLKVEHCQILHVCSKHIKVKMSQPFLTGLSCIVEGAQIDSENQS